MSKKFLSAALLGILLTVLPGIQSICAQTGEAARRAEQTRMRVEKIGVGNNRRVTVKLRDNTKLKGYISAAGGDSFSVMDSKTGASREVAYADVQEISKSGSGLSTRGWAIIGAAAVAAIIVGVTVIKPAVCDGGAGC